ncbi:MAG: C_GCAxxG_C_C family protein [Alistipes sp.]|nr:C_GCAxxG_C_C family protein [Alistipes sp.]MBO5399491.1 C_GCAxxG_C_C family protein [Alistipes sp.]
MKIENLTDQSIADLFANGIDCSQIVMGYAANKLDINSDDALKVSAAFGGGMWCGRTCGCVSGALMALGLKYGYSEPNSAEQKNALLAKKTEFEQRFAAENGSVVCKEILGYDLSQPDQMAKIMEQNLLFTICPKAVASACRLLDEML